MAFTHNLTLGWAENNSGIISQSVAIAGQAEQNFSEQVGAAAANAIALAFTKSKLQSIFIISDQAVTFTTNGTQQVNTATIVGTITGSGNATITVTAAGMTGSPHAVSVAVTNGDTASVVAGKCRTALAADADVSSFFAVGGTGATIVLTALLPAANDGTMNIASANGTCTGLTTEASSTATTAGVAPQDTFALAAGSPFIWYTGCGWSNPFASNVSGAVFTNYGATAANLNVRALLTSP